MRVELLTIGDELLLGYTIDTNGALIARELAAVGVEIVRRTSVGDSHAEIAAGVREALDRTSAVITTGGLGPTADDMTRPAIAELFGRPLRRDESLVAMLHERFKRFGYAMPQSNLVQAMVPEGARVLENSFGSAPGLWIEDERGRWVAMLPGVPREVRGMLTDVLIPLLRARVGDDARVVRSKTLRTTGIGESALAELLGDLGKEVDGFQVASLPGWEGVDLRLTARDVAAADADRALSAAILKLRHPIQKYVYDANDLAQLVLYVVEARSLTIATAESCTGGMLGARITSVAGSSRAYLGGVVAYANGVKTAMLGVSAELIASHGSVSEEVAVAMADGACTRFSSDIGIAITGIAGPAGGTSEKPVGTVWIAVRFRDVRRALGRNYVGDRDEIRRRSCQAALDLVRRLIQET
ncbi:MAG: competence/damage-inducible protein A [Gemmatimonadota bacterium]|nr:competence/damage-inducible protein A [Gemmatimonadota bacterium]